MTTVAAVSKERHGTNAGSMGFSCRFPHIRKPCCMDPGSVGAKMRGAEMHNVKSSPGAADGILYVCSTNMRMHSAELALPLPVKRGACCDAVVMPRCRNRPVVAGLASDSAGQHPDKGCHSSALKPWAPRLATRSCSGPVTPLCSRPLQSLLPQSEILSRLLSIVEPGYPCFYIVLWKIAITKNQCIVSALTGQRNEGLGSAHSKTSDLRYDALFQPDPCPWGCA